LRGFAVVAVMLRHFQYERITDHSVQLLPGGGIGVDVFFVLSGFLITTLLLQEWTIHESISLRNFYIRRGLRLFPAVAAFLVVFVMITTIIPTPTSSTGEVSDAVLTMNLIGIVTYSFNWMMAFDLDRVWGLGHLWSLSVEEQFYLAWPALIGILLSLRMAPHLILGFSLAAFLVSASIPFMWSEEDFDRFYFATDYRIHSLMVGCILSQLYVSGLLRHSLTQRVVFKVVLVLALAFLVAVVTGLRDKEPFLYMGGYTFVAIAAGVILVAALYATRGVGHWLLTNSFSVYVGKRSYALYLWHYAIGFWLREFDMIPQLVFSFVFSFAAAELSYRLVEAPALRLKGRFSSLSQATESRPGVSPQERAA
jgi:peptidoglycan/LPS O-acetylase OafA/YrhL